MPEEKKNILKLYESSFKDYYCKSFNKKIYINI